MTQAQGEQEQFELTQQVVGYEGKEFVIIIPIVGLYRKE
jgi:hypothetical protein